jgi:hypothetical protein
MRKNESQAMQVAKQLFDSGELFSNAANMRDVSLAYQANYKKENEYRGNLHAIDTVLNDTITTSYNYCGLLLKKFPEHDDALNLRNGTGRLMSHLVGNTLHLNEQMKVAAAKAALLSTIIKKGRTDITFPSLQYDASKLDEIKGSILKGEFARLERLKLTNPEAYYYWLTAEKLG